MYIFATYREGFIEKEMLKLKKGGNYNEWVTSQSWRKGEDRLQSIMKEIRNIL